MLPVGFDPTISASERLQAYALDRAATGAASTIVFKVAKKGDTMGLVRG